MILLLGFYCLPGQAQKPIGQVEITRYSRPQYAAGIQNWAFAQDSSGRIYVANNEGLLVFNGTNWQLFPVPNKTIVRSITFGPGHRLYAGAQDEFGYFSPDPAGRLRFTSLKPLLPAADQSFTDIWEVKSDGQHVFFRTDYKIFCLTGDHLSVYPSSSAWLPLFNHNKDVIAQDAQRGLLRLQGPEWQPLIEKSKLPPGFVVTDAIPYRNDTSLLCTKTTGLFLLTNNSLVPFPLQGALSNEQFTCLSQPDENSFLVGTYSNGIYHLSHQGLLLENINTETGLQNNTVRCLFADAGGNAWTGLDNGIAFLAFSNAIRHVNPAVFNNGSGYSVKSFNGNLYFALSTGLQYLPMASATDQAAIREQPQSVLTGLTWNISILPHHLLAGRDDGLWEINNQTAKNVSALTGFWTCQPFPQAASGKIIAGNYRGVRYFETINNELKDGGPVENFSESSRYLETDAANAWISHPYRGIYKIRLADNTVSLYTRKDGLPSDLDNHVFKIRGQIVFATTRGIYEYDAAANRIIPSRQYSSLFGDLSIRYLKEDEKGNIWFVHEKTVGVADYSQGKPLILYIPELKNKILSGFENIFPYNLQNVWVGSESGFYHVNYEKYRRTAFLFRPYITQVQLTANGDSILYGGYPGPGQENKNPPVVLYKWNSLRFSYAASAYGEQAVEYSYRLKGFDKNWSSWSSRAEKDYTNLPEGTYTFQIKARRGPSSPESEEVGYTFQISPPWYRTVWAYLFYGIGFFLLLYLLFRYQERKHRQKQELRRIADQKKFDEEQKQMAFQHQLELEQTEKELMRLRNENLEAELESKNAELASSATNLIQKKEFLIRITDELNKLYKPGKDSIDAADLKKVLRNLTSDDKLDEEWKQFSMHFNKVHGNFLVILKKKFPNLNAHELKLCAYLRLNLSSKEMARLLSISVRGVEIGRYRLRKKLQLQPKEDLFQFLLSLESGEAQ